MIFDKTTMRLSVRANPHGPGYGAAVWTKALLVSGGPLMLAGGSGTSAKEARTAALASLSTQESVAKILETAEAYLASLETK